MAKKKGRKPVQKYCFLCERELQRMPDDPTKFNAVHSDWTKRDYCPVLNDPECQAIYAERKAKGLVDMTRPERPKEQLIGGRRARVLRADVIKKPRKVTRKAEG